MMNKRYSLTLAVCLLVASFALAQEKSGFAKRYIKNEQAKIANAEKSGQTIGVLGRGTELVIQEETPTMAKVQLTAWIDKSELATSRPLRALHIAVKTKSEADSLLLQLKAGKDFVELAQTKSVLANAAKGGDLGYFNLGDFDPKIESAIVPLEVGQISGIIETPFGFNIFKRIQ